MKVNFLILMVVILETCNAQVEKMKKSYGQIPSINKPTKVIFDTDIAEDYDDVGAIAVLYALEKRQELEVLATMSSNAYENSGPVLSVLNTYFGKPEMPIGVTKVMSPVRPCPQGWDLEILKNYPHSLQSNTDAEDAVQLYRRILSKQEDESVVILTVGFFTNLAGLLRSQPDEHSKLNGIELVNKKVKLLISMAGRFHKEGVTWIEYNIKHDIPSAQAVFEQWNTPIIISPFEVGKEILTGIQLINNDSIINSPIKDVYQIALERDNNIKGRMSWDQTVVLIAAKGIFPNFKSRKATVRIEDDGTFNIMKGNKVSYIELKNNSSSIASIIEGLMQYSPLKF